MIIKKFQAATETEGILMAKHEMGDAAVIMNIKTIVKNTSISINNIYINSINSF